MPAPPKVPVAPLRERAEQLVERGRTWADIAAWTDNTDIKRTLGVTPNQDNRGYRAIATHVPEERALRIAEALGLDPVDIGL